MANDDPVSLGRVQRDLEIVQQALGEGYPFDHSTLGAWLGIAAVSTLGLLTTTTSSTALRIMLIFAAIALMVAVLIVTVRSRLARASAPFKWRETRIVSIAKLCVGPPLVAFVIWQRLHGVSAQYLVSTTAFLVGVITLIYATSRPWRRVGFGVAIPLLVLSGIMPVAGTHNMALAAAWTGIVAGLSCASIIAMQMRSRTTHTAG